MNRQNIVLVTVDSLRADHIYGSAADTPALDTLSAKSTTYRTAISQGPFTTFSMPSLFTSRYPSGLDYMEFSESTVGVYIDGEPTLPQIIQSAGYETAGFHSNPLLSNLFGFDAGFDTFDAQLPFSNTDLLSGRAKILTDKLLRLVRKHPYLPAKKLNKRALQWLDNRDSDQPFFLWLHYMDVHGPYIAKEGFHFLNKYQGERLWRKAVTEPQELTESQRDRVKQLYREEVEYTDTQFGALVDGLRKRNIRDETTIALTADHGEGFGEHGTFSHPHHLYDELTHVPLIIDDSHGPSGMVEEPVELLDLAPTLVNHAGASCPDSFSGTVLPKSRTDIDESPAAISEADITPAYNGSVRTDRYRYIRNEVAGTEELYDITSDPGQQRNLIDQHPDVRNELKVTLDEHLERSQRAVGIDRDVTRSEIQDTDTQERLRDLGYLE